jgi:8-oxo-dGTP diphosphatase
MCDGIAVVIGLIERGNKILITKRPMHVDHGGLWEFPGGKREVNESSLEALTRELKEELGISVIKAKPAFQFEHSYPEKTIFFDCFRVSDYMGEVEGREGQAVKWVSKLMLKKYSFPAANWRMMEMFGL